MARGCAKGRRGAHSGLCVEYRSGDGQNVDALQFHGVSPLRCFHIDPPIGVEVFWVASASLEVCDQSAFEAEVSRSGLCADAVGAVQI